jgi:hypothetical protein
MSREHQSPALLRLASAPGLQSVLAKHGLVDCSVIDFPNISPSLPFFWSSLIFVFTFNFGSIQLDACFDQALGWAGDTEMNR